MPADAIDPARFEELTSFLAPLVLGGPIALRRPFGPRLGLSIGKDRRIIDDDIRTRVEIVRMRRARMIAPIDTLPDLDVNDWALACAYNDLLQVTNHELAGRFTKGRYKRLLGSVRALCESIPPPRSARQALARHATFAHALDAFRRDSSVTWWTGKASFRGEKPPSRLLAWSDFRRVHVDEQKVRLAEMCIGIDAVTTEAFLEVLALWLSRTPLTDLATATRLEPNFAWTAPTLSLVASPQGRALATRVLAREPADLAEAALRRAAKGIAAENLEATAAVESFAVEVIEGAKLRV